MVAPGADPARIRLAIEGAKRLEIAKSGDLIAHLAGGEVRFLKPVIYQEANGKRRSIKGKYTLAEGNRIGFEIAAYDRAKPLVIDPVLKYATYLGGTEFDDARGVAVDADGNAHVVGMTSSADFPVTDGAFEPLLGGGRNGFVTKLNATGTDLIYSTYLGASTQNMFDIALDAAGIAYVMGQASADLPTTDGAFQKDDGARFVMVLDPTGSEVLYSSFFAEIKAIAVRPGCNGPPPPDIPVPCEIYVTGTTSSDDFPTTDNAFDRNCGRDDDDRDCANLTDYPATSGTVTIAAGGVLATIDVATVGDDLVEGQETFFVDITGATFAGGATVGIVDDEGVGTIFDPQEPPVVSINDVEVTEGGTALFTLRLSASTEDAVFVSFETGDGTATDPDDYIATSGTVTIPAGQTSTTIAVATNPDGESEGQETFFVDLTGATVDIVDAEGVGTIFDPEEPPAVSINDVEVTETGTASFTVRLSAPAADDVVISFNTRDGSALDGVGDGSGSDAFVAVIDPAGNESADLLYSTFLGGSSKDEGWGIAVDPAGDIYVAGRTFSNDFPVTATAFDQNCGSDLDDSDCDVADFNTADAFLAKIDPTAGAGGLVYATYLGGTSNEFALDVAVRPDCPADCKAYVTGSTTSGDFPTTAGAVVPNYTGGGSDIFVTVINPDDGDTDPANTLVYSTFVGDGQGYGIAVDTNGNAYITGVPGKGEILIRDPLQPEPAGAFLAVIDPSGVGPEEGLLFSNPGASALDIAVDTAGAAYMVARTQNRDFVTTEGAFQTKISEQKQRGKPSSSTPPADVFVVKIAGPFGSSDPVDPLNGAPIAVDDAYGMDEDMQLIVGPRGVLTNDSDPDEDPLTVSGNSSPGNGTVSVNADGSFTYTPNADFFGTDSFTYTAFDGQSGDSATVTIEVVSTSNHLPVAVDDRYFMDVTAIPFLNVGSPGVLENDSDPDGDPLTAVLDDGPLNGGLTLNLDGGFIYTPNLGFAGTDEFTYRAADDKGGASNPATVTIEVSDGTMHVGDLDGLSEGIVTRKWRARVRVRVDRQNDPVSDATVNFAWEDSRGGTGIAACTTGFAGNCETSVSNFSNRVSSVTFTVTAVSHASLPYKAADNHDPDGDSDG
ncbi:MAG: tandem-95 repeat protein, partial [Acidobacteria bacterium]|nr:tandem-95 repeat protein [Acidobacteriota bacterium]